MYKTQVSCSQCKSQWLWGIKDYAEKNGIKFICPKCKELNEDTILGSLSVDIKEAIKMLGREKVKEIVDRELNFHCAECDFESSNKQRAEEHKVNCIRNL